MQERNDLVPSKPGVKEVEIVQVRDFQPESNKAGIVSVNDELKRK